MGTINYFFVLNRRGTPIVVRAFLEQVHSIVIEEFYQRLIANPPPDPVFRQGRYNYAFIDYHELYFVLATSSCMSSSLLLELLTRIVKLLADYIGRCSELTIQTNLGLVYEIIDEVLSFGCPQSTDTTNLTPLVYHTCQYQSKLLHDILKVDFGGVQKESFFRPLALDIKQKLKMPNEIFLFLVEKLQIQMTTDNKVIRSNIIGQCYTKSFLQGSPSVLVKFDPQMTVTTRPKIPTNLKLKYDDIVFSSFVNFSSFDSDRSITFTPPPGQTILCSYRTSRSFLPPFSTHVFFENIQTKVVVVRVTLQSTYSSEFTAEDVSVTFQCPVETSSASCEIAESQEKVQKSEFNPKTRQVKWSIKEFKGLQEISARFRFIFDTGLTGAPERVLGPISFDFTLIGYLPSGLSIVDYVASTTGTDEAPQRWQKIMTTASSYTVSMI